MEDGGVIMRDWRRERLEYVEVVVRRYLENVRGLELMRDGVVRDDNVEMVVGGLKMMEVGDLEWVVGLFGVGEVEEKGMGKEVEGDRMDEF